MTTFKCLFLLVIFILVMDKMFGDDSITIILIQIYIGRSLNTLSSVSKNLMTDKIIIELTYISLK